VNWLKDFVVVELATGIAGPYAGKLFADAGARVVKVEPPSGDPLRHRLPPGAASSDTSALYTHLNIGKESVTATLDDPVVDRLVMGADLVIDDRAPGLVDYDEWRRRGSSVVILSITPFGHQGPWRNRPATNFTLQAESGSIGSRGRRDQPPVQAGGRLTDWAAGVSGAVGALAAMMGSRRTGLGEHVDCSLLATDHMITNGNVCVRHSFLGHPEPETPARIVDVPSIEPTSDGFIGVNTNTRQQVESFLDMVGLADLLESQPRWASADFRFVNSAEWNDLVRPWIRAHSTAEVMQEATKRRIPVAPVNNGCTLLDQEQFVARASLGPIPGGAFVAPRPPYRIAGERPDVTHAADARQAPVVTPADGQRGVSAAAEGSALPFDGLRVLDATSMWAGPVVGQVFAALGADVIHLESIQRLDLSRLKVDGASELDDWWERGHTWSMVNWNKRDVTLDLSQQAGRELVTKLLASCDVFVENYSPRVFEKFGLTADAVQEINPDLVFVRMPAFGLDGPWRDYIGFAQTMEQMSGLAWLTGHAEDEAPHVPRGPCDPLAGYHSLFATMVALCRRDQGHRGCMVEAAMVESALNAAAESIVDFSAYGSLLERSGNRSADAAPQGLYPCHGTEQWLAISVQTDSQWLKLTAALGNPDWAARSDLQTMAGRHAAHDWIDDQLAAWAATQGVNDAVEQLTSHGIPSGQVTDPRFADGHEQLNAFGYFEEVKHPIMGIHRLPTLPFRFAGVPRWVTRSAPRLGEHNEEVLRTVLGLTDDEIADLDAAAIIGHTPLASNPSFNM
jgi:crotonobetainyl-CoA:carnitine CoA-transferase CaiB-like acyl-CoA transferase